MGAVIVELPYDPIWRPLDWAKEHCPSYITNYVKDHTDKGMIAYCFSDPRDAEIFALKWL